MAKLSLPKRTPFAAAAGLTSPSNNSLPFFFLDPSPIEFDRRTSRFCRAVRGFYTMMMVSSEIPSSNTDSMQQQHTWTMILGLLPEKLHFLPVVRDR